MANNCNNCSGCNGCCAQNRSSQRNTYAALNSLPQCNSCANYPYYTGRCPDECGCYNCGCNAGVSNQNTRESFYNDCGGCSGKCCDNNASCCNGCRNRSTSSSVYEMFTAATPLTVAAAGNIPFTISGVGGGDFSVNGGNITLRQEGDYLAVITFQLPGDTAADSTLNLNLNGTTLPAARISVEGTTTDGKAVSYSSQTMFTASAGAIISLTSEEALTVATPVGQNLITLTLIKIGC